MLNAKCIPKHSQCELTATHRIHSKLLKELGQELATLCKEPMPKGNDATLATFILEHLPKKGGIVRHYVIVDLILIATHKAKCWNLMP